MVSTKWEALGQGGAKSQEERAPREATGCAKEPQSVGGARVASKRAPELSGVRNRYKNPLSTNKYSCFLK